MTREYYINHPQDLKDCYDALKDVAMPFMVVTKRTAATPEHKDEYRKRRDQMAYFHRSVVPEYAQVTGLSEDEAKAELQLKFARVEEVIKDESGEWDTAWKSNDKFRVFEEGKIYRVASLAGMANDELADFIEKTKNYLMIQYGMRVKEFINNIKTKKIK